jgi:hypothetical protein
MSNFRQFDRATGFLLPPSLDEWLPERHLPRFVVEVIDGLDLSAMVKSYRGWQSGSTPRQLEKLSAGKRHDVPLDEFGDEILSAQFAKLHRFSMLFSFCGRGHWGEAPRALTRHRASYAVRRPQPRGTVGAESLKMNRLLSSD